MTSGSGSRAGWASEAVVVPEAPSGQHNRRCGKGRYFVDAFGAGKGRRVPIVASTAEEQVQVLQRTLYRAAKADPGRRFHALYGVSWKAVMD
jgi:hypothetical protein